MTATDNDLKTGSSSIGVIAIGRNEGERLQRCLLSLKKQADRIVYVDSNSTDDSVAFAEDHGVDVILLDLDLPFTAARARNAGCERLLQLYPDTEFVMFLDGDCELVGGWLANATRHLESREACGVVFGLRRERNRDLTRYNKLCDMEWNPSPGEVMRFGGDSVIRTKAFHQAGGFDPSFIAGEEPEFSVRLLENGWRIECIDQDMTIHDAEMTRFGQWWRRSERAGHAYLEGYFRHPTAKDVHNRAAMRRITFWSVVIPLITIVSLTMAFWDLRALLWLPLLIGLQAIQFDRSYRWRREMGNNRPDSRLYAAFTVIGKWPMCIGALSYLWNRVRGRRRRLIEYK